MFKVKQFLILLSRAENIVQGLSNEILTVVKMLKTDCQDFFLPVNSNFVWLLQFLWNDAICLKLNS